MGHDADDLPEHYQAFASAYVGGPEGVAGNATEAWLYAVDPDAKRGTAASNGSRVLRKEKVRAYMRELRLEAADDADMVRLRDWMELAPDAQETLHRAATGQLPGYWTDEQVRSAVKAAQHILDRAIGPVAQRLDVRSQQAIVVKTLGPGERIEPSGDAAHLEGGRNGGRLIEAASTPAPTAGENDANDEQGGGG